MTRILAITGGKGGVGKTNISLNLALCLARRDKAVGLFDADLGLANINVLLGLYPEHDLEDVILHGTPIRDIIIKNFHGIDIIPGSSGVEKLANLDQSSFSRIVSLFSELDAYDFLIFDTSAGISRNVISFCLAASEVIIIITPEPTSLTDAYALLKVLCLNGFDGVARVIINQCKNTTAASRTYNKFKEVVKKYLDRQLMPLGIVIQDSALPDAVQKQQPLVTLHPQSSAAKCINVIAARLIAYTAEDFKPVGLPAFWSRFLELTNIPLQLSDRSLPVKEKSGQPVQRQQHPADAPPRQDVLREPEPAPPADVIVLPDTGREREAPADVQPGTGPEPGRQARDTAHPHPLFEKIQTSRNLPSLPHILLKLLDACGKEEVSMRELGDILQKDPALCAKLLRMVNSSYYNLPYKVHNFKQALSLLGIDTIKNIAVSAAVYQVFYGIKKDTAFNLKLFWRHSLTCAVIAGLLARKTSYPNPEEAFLAGLLHDIGKLVLLENFPKQYAALLQAPREAAALFAEEQKHLGLSHADTGFWVSSRWHLQPLVADAILYHHEPLARIEHALPLVKIVHGANAMCSANTPAGDEPHRIAAELFNLTLEEARGIVAQAEEQVSQIARSLAIEIQTPQDPDSMVTEGDRQIHADLTRQVRDVALLQGTLQQLLQAHDVHAIVQVVQHGLQILFDIKSMLFFLLDRSGKMLKAAAADKHVQQEMLDGLAIPFQDDKSLMVSALRQKDLTDSFGHSRGHDLAIIDEQLVRLLGTQGMVCLPLVAQNQEVGVVALGVDAAQAGHIKKDLKLLNLLINYAALAFYTEDLRQSQARALLAERLAASTAIAKKVAHEVNNPLGIIKNYLKILELNLSDHHIRHDEIHIINEEINRVAAIVDQLSDFSRPKIHKLEPVDVNALLTDIAKLTSEPFSARSISIQLELDSALPAVITGKDGLKQVFLNLIKNAAEAMPHGGRIHIKTRYAEDAQTADITIRDEGPGLPEIIKSRLFEPYISTKGKGHTGLGLSIVYSIIQELHGTVTCKTEKGAGTSFTIVLPAAPDGQ